MQYCLNCKQSVKPTRFLSIVRKLVFVIGAIHIVCFFGILSALTAPATEYFNLYNLYLIFIAYSLSIGLPSIIWSYSGVKKTCPMCRDVNFRINT